jgi:hypothetical protein
MPTANFSHTTKNVARIARLPAMRYQRLFARAIVVSTARQAAISMPPLMMKGERGGLPVLIARNG